MQCLAQQDRLPLLSSVLVSITPVRSRSPAIRRQRRAARSTDTARDQHFEVEETCQTDKRGEQHKLGRAYLARSCQPATWVTAKLRQAYSAERDFHRDVVLRVVGRHFLSAVLGPELVNDFSDFSRIRVRC